MYKFLIITNLVFFISCAQPKETSEFKNIALNSSYYYTSQNLEKYNKILSKIDKYFSEKTSFEEKIDSWQHSSDFLMPPYSEVFIIEEKLKRSSRKYKPTILSINDLNDNFFNIKIAWIYSDKNSSDLFAIYNIIVNGDFKFENVMNFNKDKLTKETYEYISFYHEELNLFDESDAFKLIKFNEDMSIFFNLGKPLSFKYFIFENYEKLMNNKGFDFEVDMFLGVNYGGEAYPNQKIIFSGNGSAYYPHEVVHLYTNQKFDNIHSILDEGIATYLGGSQGLSFEEYMEELYFFLDNSNINIYNTLFLKKSSVNVNDKVSLEYAFGSLLCHIIINKYDKDKLFEFMNSGREDEELLSAIERLLGIKREGLDSFIRMELKKYINVQK